MAPPPGPYSGTSTLALVARVSSFSIGLVYGSMKLKYLKVQLFRAIRKLKTRHIAAGEAKAKSHKKAEAQAHH